MKIQDIETIEKAPGFHGKFFHGDTMTIAFWDVESNKELPEHAHVHEQILHVVEGTFEVTINKKTQVLHAGEIIAIPSNVPHSGKSVTSCKLIDVFSPVREDMK